MIWYPRAFCPECNSFDIDVDRGERPRHDLQLHRSIAAARATYRDLAYVLAYVELAEGPRMLTNIVDCDVEQIAFGQSSRGGFSSDEGRPGAPRFRPV